MPPEEWGVKVEWDVAEWGGRRGRMGMQRRGLQQANTRTLLLIRSPLEIWFEVKL